jgi:hypothetical protein
MTQKLLKKIPKHIKKLQKNGLKMIKKWAKHYPKITQK